MRSWILAIGTMSLTAALAAQAPVPGTFNNTPPQTVQQTNGSGTKGGYIVAPPTISYGDGITPTVVTNQDTVQVTAPQNTAISGPTVPATNPATVNNASPVATPATTTAQPQPFDFVVAPNGENSVVGGSMEDSSVSLGDVARKYRNGRPIAKRTLTNADVEALNAQYPGSNSNETPSNDNSNNATGNAIAAPANRPNGPFSSPAGAPNSGGTAGAATGNGSAPAYAQPSNGERYGSPSHTTSGGSKPSARQGESETSEPEQAAPSNQQQAPAPSNQSAPKGQAQQQQQLPKSSSALPLLGTLGALSTLAGILYFKLR